MELIISELRKNNDIVILEIKFIPNDKNDLDILSKSKEFSLDNITLLDELIFNNLSPNYSPLGNSTNLNAQNIIQLEAVIN